METIYPCQENAGKKQAKKKQSKSSYILYDSCDKCPLWVYIDLVCDNNLASLVVTGKASEEILEDIKSQLIIEFNDISGSSDSISQSTYKNLSKLRAEINGLKIELIRFIFGENVIEKIKKYGIYATKEEAIFKLIKSALYSREIRLKSEINKYNDLTNKKEKITRSDFLRQINSLSRYIGFQIDKFKISASEFALYINEYNKEIEILNMRKNG